MYYRQGGNALLRRGEEMTMQNQRLNVRDGVDSLKSIVDRYNVTFVHGNGPQSGLLLLESAAYEQATGLPQISLDVIDAETEGMIGYLIEQELGPHVPPERGMATVLSQIVVDKNDPAFQNPTKVRDALRAGMRSGIFTYRANVSYIFLATVCWSSL